MKVFSIIGKQKMREDTAQKLIKVLESEGYSVGFIKKTDNISSNSHTKRAIIWGEYQYLFYHEKKSNLPDLLKLFDEDYVIVDNDEKSEVPKLLMYEEANLENTGNIEELGMMNNLKRREDLFFTADKDTGFDEIKQAVLSVDEYDWGEAADTDWDYEDVTLKIGEENIKINSFAKAVLRSSVETVANESGGYEEGSRLEVQVRK